jgi:hypothetical protein
LPLSSARGWSGWCNPDRQHPHTCACSRLYLHTTLACCATHTLNTTLVRLLLLVLSPVAPPPFRLTCFGMEPSCYVSMCLLTVLLSLVSFQIDLVKGMMDCLYAECKPCITDCVMAELEKLGQKYRVALKVAKVCVWGGGGTWAVGGVCTQMTTMQHVVAVPHSEKHSHMVPSIDMAIKPVDHRAHAPAASRCLQQTTGCLPQNGCLVVLPHTVHPCVWPAGPSRGAYPLHTQGHLCRRLLV